MKIEKVRAENFRSIKDEELSFNSLTALVGANGTGKSTFLKALEFFYSTSSNVPFDYFFNKDTNNEIRITVTFSNLTPEEIEAGKFSKYIQDGRLVVTKVTSVQSGQISIKYHGSLLRNPDFAYIRNASSKSEKLKLYGELIARDPKYAGLEKQRAADNALLELEKWEDANSGELERQLDEGQFLGFQGVGAGSLAKFTTYIFIPAVLDAAEYSGRGKGSPIKQLLDLVIRSTFSKRDDVRKFQQETEGKYQEIFDPNKVDEVKELEIGLAKTLKAFVPNSDVAFDWDTAFELEIPMPKSDVILSEDGFPSKVEYTGHGLQRAFLFSIFHYLASFKPKENDDAAKEKKESLKPNLVLAIEEPELFQHPSRQRHFAKILKQLAESGIPGVTSSAQVIYCTHSPLFVDIKMFDSVRLLRKLPAKIGQPKISKVYFANYEQVAKRLQVAYPGKEITAATLRARIETIMTPWVNEGFFASLVVLVEGENDKAALQGVAEYLGYDFDEMGISVIPCAGKNNLDRIFLVFNSLNIPAYLIWDSDKENSDKNGGVEEPRMIKANKALLHLMGEKEEEWPEAIKSTFACFSNDLETTMKGDIGATLYDSLAEKTKNELGIAEKKDAQKNPTFVRRLAQEAKNAKFPAVTLEKIVIAIIDSIKSA